MLGARLCRWCGVAVAAALGVASASLAEEPPIPKPKRPSHNLFGITGLIDTPTADIQPDGQMSVTAGYFGGFLRTTLSAQFLPGIEAAFRYSVLRETLGPNETLFDRSFDVKARLMEETSRWPSVAIGLQDFLGTGVYSSEYITATKGFEAGDWGSFRVSAGIGWGRYATQNGVNNPLAAISDFNVREDTVNDAGTPNFGQYFQGTDLGFFGGVEWQTPINDLVAKVEYSPDEYRRERRFGDFEQTVPANVGLQYRLADEVEIGAYYMYGSEAGARLTFTGNPFRPLAGFDLSPGPQPLRPRRTPADSPELAALGGVVDMVAGHAPQGKFNDRRLAGVAIHKRLGDVRWAEAMLTDNADDSCPPEIATAIDAHYGVIDVVTFNRADGTVLCTVALRPAGQHAVRLTSRSHASHPVDWHEKPERRDRLMEILAEELAAENIGLIGIEIAPRRVEIYIENGRYRAQPRAIGRTARALTRTMPPSVEVFEITPVEGSLPVATIMLERSQLEDQVERPNADERSWATARVVSADPVPWSTLTSGAVEFPRYTWSIRPETPASLFDPDNPVRVDLSAAASGGIEFRPGLSFNATAQKRLIGTLDDIERESDSEVERVRSEIAQYLREGDPAITRLTVDYVTKLTRTLYGRVSSGLLERMFGGVSSELLWKPSEQDWGLGLEINYAKQRDFDGRLDFQDYETATGHVSLYWDTHFHGLSPQIDVGRYLAGDWGGTMALKRRFANGWELGGFFTLTNIPFSEFGEGSFDKGIFLTIPFNWALPYESRTEYSTILRPLTRDGGQRLNVSGRLYPIVEDQDVGGFRQVWEDFWQ